MPTPEPRWLHYAAEFGAPLQTLREAAERTGVSTEAFLAVATDLRAIRALLDLACRTSTITGYSMGHPPQMGPGGETILDEEQVIMGKSASISSRLGSPPPFLSDPGESVNP